MDNREQEIKQALKSLGVTGKIRIDRSGRVYVNGKYFGTYDFKRHTFID